MPALAGGWPMFGADYLAIAVLELLQENAILQAATNGRIERRQLFTGDGEMAYPTLIVCCLGVHEGGSIGLIKSGVTIGALWCFSQFTKPLDTGIGKDEPSVASLQAFLLSLLPQKIVNDKIFSRFPELGASGARQLAAQEEFGRFDPIPIQDKNSIVAFAVGVAIKYAQWVTYPSRLAA
jgi:hypothetical protein